MDFSSCRCGFAAGCEAGLPPAVKVPQILGLAQTEFFKSYGGAEPRLTCGGEAGVNEVKFPDRLLHFQNGISHAAAKPKGESNNFRVLLHRLRKNGKNI